MVFEAIAELIAERNDCDPSEVTMETSFQDLGIDSLDTVEMLMNLEDKLGKEIELEDVYKRQAMYFRRVACPPRIWRSALFCCKMACTCRESGRLYWGSRSVRSLCTVDLLIPNCFAAARTVVRFSMMYTARSQARCSMSCFIDTTLHIRVVHIYGTSPANIRAARNS